MLFNSFAFLVFLPIVFLLYWFVFKSLKWQNIFVVVASYLFYGWWDWRFLFLIAFTTLCSFFSGILLERNEGKRKIQQWISASNIILNLLILCIFKYYNFFGENLAVLFRVFGVQLDWVTLEILLPVGISFYTFQALSYTIDVYRHQLKPTHDVVAFFAFVSFFPQLVAGPIERATNLLPQFLRLRSFDYAKAVDGCRQMLWGFFKKLLIADNCASIVNTYWGEYAELSGMTLIALGMLFTFQIYCDFSGYSDIAIGCSRLFGISLVRNFDNPYFSRNISEFWRRWHISLMKWFTDYIFIPLGGSRCSRRKTIRNILIVFLLSGFWHGASWTFIVWGLYNALLMIAGQLLGLNTKYKEVVAAERILPTLREVVGMLVTFSLVVIGWIIFRAENMEQVWSILVRIPTHFFDGGLLAKKMLVLCFLFLIIEWFQREKQHTLQFPVHGIFRYVLVRYGIYGTILYLMIRYTGEIQTFIYFQF